MDWHSQSDIFGLRSTFLDASPWQAVNVIGFKAEVPVKDYFDRLFRYCAWANRKTLASFRDCPAAHAEGTPLIAHLLAAEHVRRSRLQSCEPTLAVWPRLSLGECETLAAESDRKWADHMSGLAGDGLLVNVEYHNSRGESFRNSVADILTQVVTHGGYHRGQIAKVVGRVGGTAAGTDFIMFIRAGGPVAE